MDFFQLYSILVAMNYNFIPNIHKYQILKLNINECLSTANHRDILSHKLLEAVYIIIANMK